MKHGRTSEFADAGPNPKQRPRAGQHGTLVPEAPGKDPAGPPRHSGRPRPETPGCAHAPLNASAYSGLKHRNEGPQNGVCICQNQSHTRLKKAVTAAPGAGKEL